VGQELHLPSCAGELKIQRFCLSVLLAFVGHLKSMNMHHIKNDILKGLLLSVCT
jgi:hypothetical protein